MTFKLGYSTYALGMVDPFEAVRKSREIGYEAIEICVKDEWPTFPARFGSSEQKKLGALCRELGFPSPILFGNINVCASGDDGQSAMLGDAKAKFVLAQNMHYDDTPILVTTTAGHDAPAWDTGKEQIRDSFLRLADLAAEHDAIIAIEAHAGTDFETPEKAVWIIEQTQHPNLKLDLDISHFYVEGAEVVHSVDLCAPHSAMVHIKDGTKDEEGIHYCLTGAGTIDIPLFMTALRNNGLEDMPVYAEVSMQQSGQPDYDPWWTAQFCYDALDKGRKAVG